MHEHAAYPQVKLKTGTTPETTDVLSILEKGKQEAVAILLTLPAHHDKIQGGDTAEPAGGTTRGGFLPTTQLDKHLSFHVSVNNPAEDSQSKILIQGKHFENMFKIDYQGKSPSMQLTYSMRLTI